MDLGERLVQDWLNTLMKHSSTSIVNLYSDKAILLGTLASKPLVGKAEIFTYFEDFVKLHPMGVMTWSYIQDLGYRRIVVDGSYVFCLDDKNNPDKKNMVDARFTFIFKRNWFGEWKIVTHHSSENPKENKNYLLFP